MSDESTPDPNRSPEDLTSTPASEDSNEESDGDGLNGPLQADDPPPDTTGGH